MQLKQLSRHQINLHHQRIGYLGSLIQVILNNRSELESQRVFRAGVIDYSNASQFVGRLRNLHAPWTIDLNLALHLVFVALWTHRDARLIELALAHVGSRRAVRIVGVHIDSTAIVTVVLLMPCLLKLALILLGDIRITLLNRTLLIIIIFRRIHCIRLIF